LAAGFVGLISGARGGPPPTAQPWRLLRSLAAGPFGGFPGRLRGAGPGASAGPGTGAGVSADLLARPGPAAPPPGRPARLGGAVCRALLGAAATAGAARGAPGRR